MEKIKKIVSGRFTLFKVFLLYIRFLFTSKDNRILEYKNKYLGKRCFIIGLGPSLQIKDLEALGNNKEYSFSVNRIYELYEKTSWRPDFYYISDKTAATEETRVNIEKMIQNNESEVFYSRHSFSNMPEDAIPCRILDIYTPLHNTKSKILKKLDKSCKFSMDASDYIHDGMSCVLAVIQLAYFMGFREIYLLGCDCGSKEGREYGEGLKRRDKNYYEKKDVDMLLEDYKSLADDIKKKKVDINIYNATRGGILEEFERVNIDELLKK